ncbi:hypothetical protein [Ralstonia pseudosolanacearum]|uniref:hypothetical protein n=1 Tax=Ralstonia pseudosolanacearum TaxID=1310165 RepID=UPI001E2B0A49|nr:hypothetical protein [Ralstonia pseudosolanacearum]
MQALAAASQKLGEKIYADVQTQAGADPNRSAGAQEAGSEKSDEEVTDVEFKEGNPKR